MSHQPLSVETGQVHEALAFRRQTLTERTLPFRAYLQGYPSPDENVFWNRQFWEGRMREWREEHYNAVVWYGPGELTNGEHLWIHHNRFPEARMLPGQESDRRISMMSWLFDTCRGYGICNLLLTQPIFFTHAFGEAHDLNKPMPVSPTVYERHNSGYPNFWPGNDGPALLTNCGVRNELTRAYTEAVYSELLDLYESLDGFYGFLGEPLPGDRASFFREAIAPALRASRRSPLFIACQWEASVESFLESVVPTDVYDNTWLGFHGYNSEVITDKKPYPGLVYWSEVTDLPTVAEIYPANAMYLPFNSPRFAYEIISEVKKVEGLAGFIYAERYTSGTRFGPLFRKALALYATSNEPYSDEPWLQMLSQQFGSDRAAPHFLEAYDFSGRIFAELCALVYSGSDVLQRTLRLPYDTLIEPRPWSFMTSPARGEHLIPIQHYALWYSRDPDRYGGGNGADPSESPHFTRPVWSVEGGSVFAVTPPMHMLRIRHMGVRARHAATEGHQLISNGQEDARLALDFMIAFDLLSEYYKTKVAASIEILAYENTRGSRFRERGSDIASHTLEAYTATVTHLRERLAPVFGGSMQQRGRNLEELMEDERDDYREAMRRLAV